MNPAADSPACRPDPSGRCATCADEAVEGRVVAMLGDSLASVEMEGRLEEVAVELLDTVGVGDHVLVHAGVALARLER